MLYLGAGMREVRVDDHAVHVFPDFSDPLQFYYLPNFPQIAENPDGSPAIRLLVFREDLSEIEDDEEEAVAFLMLDVDLRWDPQIIEDAASRIRLTDNLSATPRLTPITFRRGAVQVMLLDAESSGDDDDDEAQPTRFVTKLSTADSPALYGDNRAIVQAALPKRGATALSAAIEGVTPIGVVYSLTFAGLQPAFNVKARVDWERVHTHLSSRENTNALFYEKDIQKSIDELVDERSIVVEETIEGIGTEAMDADREKVMTLVRQLIFEKFFEATFERETPADGGTGDQIADSLRVIAQDAITLGIGYTYAQKEVEISELRSLSLDWTARRATERTIYPQAHMHNLMAEGGVTRDQLITVVDGADGIWKVTPIEVVTTAAWETDGIVGISVELEYTDADSAEVRSVSRFLDADAPEFVHRDWMDRMSGNDVRYKYEVVFRDDDVAGPSPKISSGTPDDPWIDHEGTTITIHPRELFESVALEVGVVQGFAFDQWPAVQAVIRYRTDDGSFEHIVDDVLEASNPKFSTRFRADRDVPARSEVRLTYVADDGRRIATDWEPLLERHKVVEDPEARTPLVVRAAFAGDRTTTAHVLVDLRYVDEANGLHDEQHIAFNSTNFDQIEQRSFRRADPMVRRYSYRVTLITQDGDFVQTGWITTDSPTLPVGEKLLRTLEVEAVTGELDDDVRAVELTLAYDDEEHDVHHAETVELTGSGRFAWTIEIADPAKRTYEYTITWRTPTGFDRSRGPVTTNDTLLVIPGGPGVD